MVSPINGIAPIVLEGTDVALFMAWAIQPPWRAAFESDLQSVANDAQGRQLLTTWVPLVIFRERFCLGGREMQNAVTQALMLRLRELTRDWRTGGVDTVEIFGRLGATPPVVNPGP